MCSFFSLSLPLNSSIINGWPSLKWTWNCVCNRKLYAKDGKSYSSIYKFQWIEDRKKNAKFRILAPNVRERRFGSILQSVSTAIAYTKHMKTTTTSTHFRYLLHSSFSSFMVHNVGGDTASTTLPPGHLKM